MLWRSIESEQRSWDGIGVRCWSELCHIITSFDAIEVPDDVIEEFVSVFDAMYEKLAGDPIQDVVREWLSAATLTIPMSNHKKKDVERRLEWISSELKEIANHAVLRQDTFLTKQSRAMLTEIRQAIDSIQRCAQPSPK